MNRNEAASAERTAETILVVGGGIAGLSLALALEGSGKQVVIVERDSEPPELSPHEAFEGWKRPGVWQFRYPHVFVGRLHGLLRSRYPQLFAELTQAGFRPSTLGEHLPPALREGYRPDPADAELAPLYGRRPIFEYVLRRYVGRLAHVRFLHDTTVQGLLCEREPDGLRIAGLELKRGDARETLRGDVIVDAAGRNSPVRGWLQALGVQIELKQKPSQLAYFCRHYRLREGEVEPEHRDLSADLDYLKYAIFYAERGHFAIAFGCAEYELDLVELLRRADGFDGMCRQIPALAPWVERAEPVTKVLGAAKIANRRTRIERHAGVRGMFLLGDAAFEANPIYGRGCAAAFVQAQLLAQALVAETDHARRAARLRAGLQREIQPYHRASVLADRQFRSRASRARGLRVSLLFRLELFAYEKMIVPGVLVDMFMAREILKVMGMVDPPSWLRVVGFALRAVQLWILRRGSAALRLLPPHPGRADLLRRVSVPLEPEPGGEGAVARQPDIS